MVIMFFSLFGRISLHFGIVLTWDIFFFLHTSAYSPHHLHNTEIILFHCAMTGYKYSPNADYDSCNVPLHSFRIHFLLCSHTCLQNHIPRTFCLQSSVFKHLSLNLCPQTSAPKPLPPNLCLQTSAFNPLPSILFLQSSA